MVSARGPLLLLAGLVVLALLAVFALKATGEDLGELWQELALPLMVLAACLALLPVLALASAAARLRKRRRRPLARYQLVLSQADEAPLEEVAAACEQLVQTVRASLTERLSAGQPWLALESWFLPPQRAGETGAAALMLVCHPATRDRALAALRHAYPDLTLRPDPRAADGRPLGFV
jgi:type VI protein secretion system component VasK